MPSSWRVRPRECLCLTSTLWSIGPAQHGAGAAVQIQDPLPADTKDRGQVRAMWQWARDLDRENLLWREFCRPIEIENGSKEDFAIQLTERWILGCSQR
jgi:hypothetical protein